MKVIRSAFFYLMIVISTIVMGTTATVLYYVTRGNDLPHWAGRVWAKWNLWAGGIDVLVRGIENIEGRRAYIYTPNHQSWFDIFALFANLPYQFRWLAKEELFKVPFLGMAMKATGAIPIDRGDRRKSLISMNRAAERVKSGTSILIFPEGTRSPDGLLQEFKKGGFILALKSQQPIVPVTISGSYSILPKNAGWLVNPGTMHVTIGTPIETAELTTKDRDALNDTVREAIQKYLPVSEGGTLPG